MRFLLLLLLCLPAMGRASDTVVTSKRASDIAVTIYRDPYRDSGAMNANWPGGYALITETRTITIPRGESRIRFENVAEGLLPETAIVTGLPSGVREKNRDARLISPAGLVDAFLKRRVLIRRTDPATGRAREESAIIQAGPDGGVVLQTASGVEALRCSGLPERMIYGEIPDSLTARPTLSIITRSDRAITATIQLTYMAQGFDWSANYVGNVAPAGGKIGLFAWLTVANGGQQSFPDARLQVIAGKPNKRPNNPPPPPPSAWLNLECWPMDVTSTHPKQEFVPLPLPRGFDLGAFNSVGTNAPGSFETRKQRKQRLKREAYAQAEEDLGSIVVTGSTRGGYVSRRERRNADAPPPPPPPPPSPMMEAPMAITVISADSLTVAKGAQAGIEELGDLKLYRVPMRVTVAAQAQKQVAMLQQPGATFARVYVINVTTANMAVQPAPFWLRSRNVAEAGLGQPLPAGSVALFERGGGRNLLVGEYPLEDLAVGQDVEWQVGASPDVTWKLTRVSQKGAKQQWRVDITNARDVAVDVEVIVPFDLEDKPPSLERGRGGWKLPVTVAANDRASVGYSVKLR